MSSTVRRTQPQRGGQAGRVGTGKSSARSSTKPSVKRAKRPEVRLPPLTPFGVGATAGGGGLEPDGDYDGVEFHGLDLAGQDGGGARFLDCAVRDCALTETRLSAARFIDSVLDSVRGVGTDLGAAVLRDVEIKEPRLGGVQLHGATLERVVISGGKIDYLNLRQSRVKDVVFENCVLVEPDFSGATLERVEFVNCALKGVDFDRATMKDVDLRGASELDISRGIDRLAGTVISPSQLVDLAPAFAAQTGVRVEA
ncbi:pentapeptide repeat-containing protein [Streptomyces tsukubensis]|uniref:pentapeptide repeat-containing protein n=1 Tax=Streptomyces tsukubensis TaxID=83656 RepID=UPI00098F5EA1|nr:pentapeptide repeat-containing protein [Streptomyces tsukubensis]QFR94241.1 pentapeptide repeat-containing protein [Streptomyces tsukubensis]